MRFKKSTLKQAKEITNNKMCHGYKNGVDKGHPTIFISSLLITFCKKCKQDTCEGVVL